MHDTTAVASPQQHKPPAGQSGNPRYAQLHRRFPNMSYLRRRARERVPHRVRELLHLEIENAADAIAAALDEFAGEISTVIRVGPDQAVTPARARAHRPAGRRRSASPRAARRRTGPRVDPPAPRRPTSHEATVCCETPRVWASCTWVMPESLRSAAMRAPSALKKDFSS